MSEHVLITVHKGCDVYTSCAQCGEMVIEKRHRPALYLESDGGEVPVCWECARHADPETIELLDALKEGE